jgi:hypothetical protein
MPPGVAVEAALSPAAPRAEATPEEEANSTAAPQPAMPSLTNPRPATPGGSQSRRAQADGGSTSRAEADRRPSSPSSAATGRSWKASARFAPSSTLSISSVCSALSTSIQEEMGAQEGGCEGGAGVKERNWYRIGDAGDEGKNRTRKTKHFFYNG